MSDPTSEILQMAAEAAETLIGFYPSIQASDPKIYAAGLVQLFSRYPEHLVAQAIDAANGLPSLHDFPPTMKQTKEFLEPRWRAEVRKQDMIERFNRKRLPAPPPDPEGDARMAKRLQDLAEHLRRGFGPSTQ